MVSERSIRDVWMVFEGWRVRSYRREREFEKEGESEGELHLCVCVCVTG